MGDSLFQRKPAGKPTSTSPYDLIQHEITHLKKGTTARHGNKPRKKMSLWLVALGACGLAWLYLMDPIEHAWYKGEAVKTYVYLHNYGVGKEADQLAGSGILAPEEVAELDQRHGSFQDYYATPKAAAQAATTIVSYMASVKLLHSGRYEQLGPVGRMRYLLFIRTGLFLPTSWDFLDPSVNE
jgi:hypothetical protein